MGVGALARTPSVAAVHGDAISLTTLTQSGGGRYLHSGWLLFTSQWADLKAPPMNALRHTVVFSWKDGRLYIWPVLRRWDPFVTVATLGSCRNVLCLSPVSAVELLRAVSSFSQAVFVEQSGPVMVTGSGQADVDKPGRDIPILR